MVLHVAARLLAAVAAVVVAVASAAAAVSAVAAGVVVVAVVLRVAVASAAAVPLAAVVVASAEVGKLPTWSNCTKPWRMRMRPQKVVPQRICIIAVACLPTGTRFCTKLIVLLATLVVHRY
mgnify:FL=1